MPSIVKITRLFAEASNNRKKVSSTPNDDHVVNFKEELLSICLQIAFEGTDTSDPSAAIPGDARYQAAVSTSLPYDHQVAACANYDPNLEVEDPTRRAKE